MIKEKQISLIPVSMYFSGNKVKLEVGIGKGKKLYDKRESIKQKDLETKRFVSAFDSSSNKILIITWYNLQDLFNYFTYLDGSPCGIKE